jgi:hypothetical protein
VLIPERLTHALCDEGVGFVLIGGIAARAMGSAHLTDDYDVCYARERVNYDRILSALAPLHPRPRFPVGDTPPPFDAHAIEMGENFLLEGLIRAKRAAGRTKDLLVLPELQALLALQRQGKASE